MEQLSILFPTWFSVFSSVLGGGWGQCHTQTTYMIEIEYNKNWIPNNKDILFSMLLLEIQIVGIDKLQQTNTM